MTEQITSSTEEIVLDRFEYVLPKGMYVVYKNSTGFKYQLKHTKKWFDSEDKVLEFIDKTLKERKRYQQLLKTLSVPELSKLFSDAVLLGLSPVQIKEYEAFEQFEYQLVIDDDWSLNPFSGLEEVKSFVADRIGLNFHSYLDLVSIDKVIVQGY